MKISKYKEIQIDDNSKNAINDYNTKKISMNLLYYKIFLGMFIIANIGLFIFIIIYQNKIKEIESLTHIYSTQSKQKDELNNNLQFSIDNKLTNLIAISEKRSNFFSYSFTNKSEYDLVKNFIIEYVIDLNNIFNFEYLDKNYQIKMIYQSVSDYFNYIDLVSLLNYRNSALIIINTLEDEKFGIFIYEMILFNKKNKLTSPAKNIFLFSFKNKRMLKYIGENPGIKIDDKSEIIFSIGNDEIVIYNYNYFNHLGGSINYPLNSFEKINGIENNFININGNFEIKNMEIFEIKFGL